MSYHLRTMPLLRKFISIFLVLLLLISTNSCSMLAYYQQSISGQLVLMSKRRSIDRLLKQKDLPVALRNKLLQAKQIRKYASDVLHLPDNNSYRSYADLGRKYVLWNVVATPEFSLEPLKWCYLIVGCLSYRGYFSRDDAIRFAKSLKRDGYDVDVAGVAAYSTLGWFADPVVNTMLQYDTTYMARVIFHELAHQLIYFANDTEFNEAFADTVSEYGVRRWLQDENMVNETAKFERDLAREHDFNQLVMKYKAILERLYRSNRDKNDLRRQKQKVFANMQADYEKIRSSWNGSRDYQEWFDSGLNNAKLALVLTYQDLVPGFFRVLARDDYDLPRFYQAITRLKHCNKAARRRYLATPRRDFSC